MEKKTIGAFIAALRKASGLTQRQLAEKLNVSDKAVSRWERDEAMPDLMLIPVLAEIFGVTSDEILRGERHNPSLSAEKAPEKAEKQRKRIIDQRQTKYRIRSTASVGIAVLGLIAAMICNYGFLRAYLGFMIGCVFFVAAGVCQAIFLTLQLSGLDEDILSGEALVKYREHACQLAAGVFGTVITLVCACLPLITIPWDTYQGLEGEFWALYGAVYAVIAVIVLGIIWSVVRLLLARRGLLHLDSIKAALLKLRLRFAGILALVFAVLLILQAILNCFLPSMLMEGTQLHSWEEFKTLMEIPAEYDEIAQQEPISGVGIQISVNSSTESVDIPVESVPTNSENKEYHDDGSIAIRPDEVTDTIYANNGSVLCEFVHRNHSISSWRYDYKGEDLTITVYTTQDIRRANSIMDRFVNPIYVSLYPLTFIVLSIIYRKQAKQIQDKTKL